MTTSSGKDQNSALEAWLSRKKTKPSVKGISVKPDAEPALLSHGQERLWLLEQLYPNQNLYHYAHRYRIEGPVEVESLITAFQELAQRHEVIRSRYSSESSQFVQKVSNEPLPVEYFDFKQLSESEKEEQLRVETSKLCSIPFNLETDTLFRIYCFYLDENTIEILIVLHHIIGDAWSMGIINEELSELYLAQKNNTGKKLPSLEIQYEDFAFWQRQQTLKEADLKFWKNKLSGDLPQLNLPIKQKRSTNYQGEIHKSLISKALKEKLISLAQENEVTMFTLMLASFKVLLSKYSEQTDIIVGSPFSNRDQKSIEKLVGFFNETLVLRTEVSAEKSFNQLLQEVNTNTLEALSHKNVPFDTLINELKIERHVGQNPVFQTMFLYNTVGKKLFLGEEINIKEEVVNLPISKFDLTLFVNERAENLELVFEYTRDFESKTIEAMSLHFTSLLENLLESPNKNLKEVSLFSEQSLNENANFWNGENIPFDNWESVHSLISKKANINSSKAAVITSERTITYKELDIWSDQIAQKLKDERIKANDFVGLLTPRSVEMIVGILGILKAGAAYLPLDPDYPNERLEFMITDSKAQLVLTHPSLESKKLGQSKIILLDEVDDEANQKFQISSTNSLDDFAYLIYTSGSTGQPKGVAVTHKNLLESTLARFEFYKDEMERFLLLSSFSFDSSVAGIFWSLCSGGTLVLPKKHIEQDINALSDIIEQEEISHTLMLPSLYQVVLDLVDKQRLKSLKAVIVAGEACSTYLKDLHFDKLPQTRLYNEYGPTETSVWCIAHEIASDDTSIPIGRPIPNYKAYILNKSKQPVPLGAIGEIYIGGKGVTPGYLNRPELTDERFVENPFSEASGKMYKTGDLARFRPDGIIEFLGRADEQVKIRGFRVEPEEIKNQILQHEDVSDCVVRVIEDEKGSKQLAAWIQSGNSEIQSDLKKELQKVLPDYMVPSHFVVEDQLPQLPNGKVDVSKLTAPKNIPTSESDYKAPSTEKEKLLVSIWEQVLGVSKLGVNDNFFDNGGDSIQSIRILSKAREKGLEIGQTDIFKFQNIEALANEASWIEEKTNEESNIEYPHSFPLSYQQQGFLLHSLQANEDQGFLQLEFIIHGNVDKSLMKKAWQEAIKQHPILRTSFHWENLAEPHQTIHKDAPINWKYKDLSEPGSDAKESIRNIKDEDKGEGFNLNQPGGGRLLLLKLSDNEYHLIWTCHHILIDGWSGAIIVKDVLLWYQKIAENEEIPFKLSPRFDKFLEWKAGQNQEKAKAFWQAMFAEAKPPLFSKGHSSVKSNFKDLSVYPVQTSIKKLQELSKNERLTINSVYQGLWMLTLASYFQSEEISLGLTLTGRSSSFSGIDRLTGLLMNVLPVRKQINADADLSSWLLDLQTTLNELREFEYVDTNRIQEWTKAENQSLFDSLFVFGNFMSEALTIGDLTIDEFRGGFSATFPLTIRVNPAEKMEINCRYDANIIDERAALWLLETYESLINKVAVENGFKGKISSLITNTYDNKEGETKRAENASLSERNSFVATRNLSELKLLKIWEKILGTELISVHDNYFDLGGSSLGAIKLFAEIEKTFGKKLSPTAIVNNPTIASLAKLLGEEENEEWSSIVPMKTSGDSLPLFCIHSGGAHILFYQGLAKYMNPERPVYAIQPMGIDGEEEMHADIPEMASHYISEIQKIQPHGPYHLIGTCFGNAVGVEIAHQLKEKGEELAVLYVIDSAPAYLEPPSPNGERKPISRMAAMLKKGDWKGILKKFAGRYNRVQRKLTNGSKTQQELELDEIVDSLNGMYTKYSWRPLKNKVVLIRSKEFSNRKDKFFHLDRWNYLGGEELEVYEVDGSHLTLFEEPEVKGLTKKVVEHMNTLEIN